MIRNDITKVTADAIGYGVEKMVNIQRHLPEDERAEKVIFVITTDGLENASKRFSYEKIRWVIAREKERYGWEFLFLGANIDAVETARHFGIDSSRAVNYHADHAGTALNFEVLSDAVSAVRASKLGGSWKDRIEKDFKKRK